MYLGNLVQLKTTTVSHKNHKLVRKDEAEWVVVPNTHEAIITQGAFYRQTHKDWRYKAAVCFDVLC